MPASRPPVSSQWLLPAVLRQFLPGGRTPAAMNPLVLVDPIGTTATQLLRDIHGVWTAHAAGSAAWLPGRDLGRELAAAAESGTTLPLASLERSIAGNMTCRGEDPLTVLIVPEVDQLGSAAAQRPFTGLLDMAIRSGVLCCVSLVSLAASGLEPRLASRLAAGLVLPLSQPEHRSSTTLLASALRTTPRQTPSVRRVITAAARQHGVEPEDLVGPSRRRGITEPRAIAMFVLRLVSGRSLHAIGRSFGGRDHTTVMHAIRLVGERISHDPATARDVERLVATVTSSRNGNRCRIDVG